MSGYGIDDYGAMIVSSRTDAYAEALRIHVRPGDTVLDIGTGAGIFALLACRFGAGRVHAVESASIIQIAREIITANGFADRVTFHHGLSTALQLAEKADVVVADIRGALPFSDHAPEALIHARRELLNPGGVLIPRADEVFLALVEAPEEGRKVDEPWHQNRFAFDMTAGAALAANRALHFTVTPSQLLSDGVSAAVLDYRTLETCDLSCDVELVARRAGVAHGLCAWFDTTLSDGVGYSNHPSQPELPYGRLLFRWPRAIAVEEGMTARVSLRARQLQGQYIWIWNSELRAPGGQDAIAHFRQSTFHGMALAPELLAAAGAEYAAARETT